MVTAERVRELLSYDPSTGEFRWRVDKGRVRPGDLAGVAADNGRGKKYWKIKIDGRKYLAHRLAWLVTHGHHPLNVIDHIDGNGRNNRLQNLRSVSVSENQKNLRKSSNNTSGVVGVVWCKARNKWQAQIKARGKNHNLGRFESKTEATIARKAAEAKYGFHANHGSEKPR